MSYRMVVLDTETTGISPKQGHRIIEIGCVEIVDRDVTGNNLQFYINPERDIDAGAQRVHGITREFLEDKPKFDQVVDRFLKFIEGAELVIHNAPFDVGFIAAELERLSHPLKDFEAHFKVTDTLALARKKHPGQKNNLDALCKRYEIDNSNRNLHGALLDSEILAEVYLAMTGGQEQFAFSSAKRSAKQETTSSETAILPVLRATEEEQSAHASYIEEMKKSAETLFD